MARVAARSSERVSTKRPFNAKPAGRVVGHTDLDTSRRMGGVRQSSTAAELLVRRIAHSTGLRYRISNRDLPGSPDLANRSRRWAIFVHGCFWHRHEGCKRSTTPTRNREFWIAKFRANVERDLRVVGELRRLGWRVVIVWECESESRVRSRLRRLTVYLSAGPKTR